jgi:hypothetical protein
VAVVVVVVPPSSVFGSSQAEGKETTKPLLSSLLSLLSTSLRPLSFFPTPKILSVPQGRKCYDLIDNLIIFYNKFLSDACQPVENTIFTFVNSVPDPRSHAEADATRANNAA